MRPKAVLGRPTSYVRPLGHSSLAKISKKHCARAGQPSPPGGVGASHALSLFRKCLTNGQNSGVVKGDTNFMAARGHAAKEGLMSHLGVGGHQRGNIAVGALYVHGAAAVLAAARAPARSAVESPGEEPAAKRPPSAVDLWAFSDLPLAGPPQLWP
jgi:hypothetical protein